MRPHETSRTFRVLGVLILGLVVVAPAVQSQTNSQNPCRMEDGQPAEGVWTGTVEGKLEMTADGNQLVFPLDGEVHWMRGNEPSTEPILNGDAEVVVPPLATALLTIDLGDGAQNVQQIRFTSGTLSNQFQPVAPTVWAAVDSDNQLFLCDENSDENNHTWSFGVNVGGTWYDPQIENIGEETPP